MRHILILIVVCLSGCGYELKRVDNDEPVGSTSIATNEPSRKQRNRNKEFKHYLNRVSANVIHADINETFGGISNLLIQVDNPTPLDFDYVNVSIDYILANGNVYKNEALIFKDISSNSVKFLKAPDCPRGTRVNVGIIQYYSDDLPAHLNKDVIVSHPNDMAQ